MPSGIYKRTKQQLLNISKSQRKRFENPNERRKISDNHASKKLNYIPPHLGKNLSDLHRLAISNNHQSKKPGYINPMTGLISKEFEHLYEKGYIDGSNWSNSIKDIYDYECIICETTKNLEAHHIYPQSLYIHKIDDLNNGMCFCRQHHIDAHNLLRNDPNEYFIVCEQLRIKLD